jgi:hypothetical protein
MAARINYEDAPECGDWGRKHNRSRFSLKTHEGKSTCEEEGPRFLGVSEAKYMVEQRIKVVCDMQDFQDPSLDDVMALEVAFMQSGEEAAAADICIGWSADDLHDAASEDVSEATDNWDMCETASIASIASSWLDIHDHHGTTHVIEEEDLVVIEHGSKEASRKIAKTPSFAEILTRSIETSRGAAPRLVKPNWSTSQVLKPVAEHPSHDQGEAIEDWELYKSPSGQHWNRKFRKGLMKKKR